MRVQDTENAWYEALIRCVRTTQDGKKQIAIHYIGWAIKWDEWLDCDSINLYDIINNGDAATQVATKPRIGKRNTMSLGPHRPKKRHNRRYNRPGDQYQTQLSQLNAMGFNDRDLNVQALNMTNGDIQQTVAVLFSHASIDTQD